MISRNFSGCQPSFLDRSAESVGSAVRHRSQNSVERACISCGIPAYWLDSVEMGREGKAATQGRGSPDVRPLFPLWSDDRWEAQVRPSLLGAQRFPITLGDFRIVAWRHAKPRRNCQTDRRPLVLGTPMWEELAVATGCGCRDRASRPSELHQRGTLGIADERALDRDLSSGALARRDSDHAASEPALRCPQPRIVGLAYPSVASFRIVACRPDHRRGFDRLWQLNDSLMSIGDNQTWVSRFTGDG